MPARPSAELITVREPSLGLVAFICLDDETLGPAAGGIRTRAYPNEGAAIADVQSLARAMTVKCALGGLAAGGGKAVVVDTPELRRAPAFEALGDAIQALDGRFRTAGDLGTTPADLATVARHTQYVHSDEPELAAAVALGLRRCLEAATATRQRPLAGLRVAIQGCGAIGAAVARELSAAGAALVLADLDLARATALAEELGATTIAADAVLTADCDVIAPCAVGQVITRSLVPQLRAWGICGAANNVLATSDVASQLVERDILHVPDVLASAGAVIDGIGRSVMGLADRRPLIDRLGATTAAVLAQALASGRPPQRVALELADAILSDAKGRE